MSPILKARPLWLGQGPLGPLVPALPANPANQAGPPCTSTIPDGYGPLPGGGAAPGKSVYACQQQDGTYAVFNQADGSFVIAGIAQSCLALFGSLQLAPGDSRCNAQSPQVPGTGCSFPKDRPIVVCPPSNGSTVGYAVDGTTGNYVGAAPSPDCLSQPNVFQVGVENPFCGGNAVINGPGIPDLVVCYVSAGIVNVYSAGPDFTLLASNISDQQITTQFPGKYYVAVQGANCHPTGFSPSAGGAAPAQPAPVAPAPVPAAAPVAPPAPVPAGMPVQNPGAGFQGQNPNGPIPVQNFQNPNQPPGFFVPPPPGQVNIQNGPAAPVPPSSLPTGGVTPAPTPAPSPVNTTLVAAGGVGIVGLVAALAFGVFKK